MADRLLSPSLVGTTCKPQQITASDRQAGLRRRSCSYLPLAVSQKGWQHPSALLSLAVADDVYGRVRWHIRRAVLGSARLKNNCNCVFSRAVHRVKVSSVSCVLTPVECISQASLSFYARSFPRFDRAASQLRRQQLHSQLVSCAH